MLANVRAELLIWQLRVTLELKIFQIEKKKKKFLTKKDPNKKPHRISKMEDKFIWRAAKNLSRNIKVKIKTVKHSKVVDTKSNQKNPSNSYSLFIIPTIIILGITSTLKAIVLRLTDKKNKRYIKVRKNPRNTSTAS